MRPLAIGVKRSGRIAWLDEPAAASYARMVAAGCPSDGITDAGRTHEEQVEIFLSRYEVRWVGHGPYSDVRWWKGKRYVRVRGASAATPGKSNHESGRALDLAGAALEWVRAHGPAYGWIADRVKGERWHIEYIASRDTRAAAGGATGAAPAPKPAPTPQPTPTTDTREPIVRILHDADRNNWYRAGELSLIQLTTAAQVAADLTLWGPAVEVTYVEVEEQVRRTQAAQASLRHALA